MKLLDLETWQELGQSLARHPTRTLLTGAGVCWGMFLLVVMVAFGRGLQHGVMKGLSEYATQAVWIWPERTTMAHEGQLPGRRLTIHPRDLEGLRRDVPGIAAMSPRNSAGSDDETPVAVHRGARRGSFVVTGEGDEVISIRPMRVDEGRFISPLDVVHARKVAFLGSQVRRRLFEPDEDPIGASIVVRGVELVVAGVFHLERTGEDAAEQENGIILPWTTVAKVYGPRDRLGAVAILARDGVDPLEVELGARRWLARRYGVHPEDHTAFDGWNPRAEVVEMQALFGGIEVLLWAVGACTLLAGAFGAGNVVMVAVRERTAEIGLRKALGATNGDVVSQIVLESVGLTLVSGYLGLVLGVFATRAVGVVLAALPEDDRPSMAFTPVVDADVTLLGLAVLVFAGLVASWLPARAGASIAPAHALQRE